MELNLNKPLFIFEMANNHQGNVEHGLKIVREMYNVAKDFDFQFAVKLQYRELDSFIHPKHKQNSDAKLVQRFSETRLSRNEFLRIKEEIVKHGFLTICTPFDESSVDLFEEHGFDILKIASCSFTDWPLLERIAKTDTKIIASVAGSTLEEIDNVVTFLKNRNKKFILMHCVAEYPTQNKNLQLNQIDILKKRYPDVAIGFSTHEDPSNVDSVKLCIAKGVKVFEKHVGVETSTIKLNSYSATPEQVRQWLKAAEEAFEMCGATDGRYLFSEKEQKDLRALRRGVFASRKILKGESINLSNTFFAIPNEEGQLLANDMSKYTKFVAQEDIETNEPIMLGMIKQTDIRLKVESIIFQVNRLLKESKITIPNHSELEISHHYGIERVEEYGAVIINCINREYCKKIIIVLPGQMHPAHYHLLKEETFHVLYGEMTLNLEGEVKHLKPGDTVLIEREKIHSFTTNQGVIFEELSTTHYNHDSYYLDGKINESKDRKTKLSFWMM